jgi:hypothetical protein
MQRDGHHHAGVQIDGLAGLDLCLQPGHGNDCRKTGEKGQNPL